MTVSLDEFAGSPGWHVTVTCFKVNVMWGSGSSQAALIAETCFNLRTVFHQSTSATARNSEAHVHTFVTSLTRKPFLETSLRLANSSPRSQPPHPADNLLSSHHAHNLLTTLTTFSPRSQPFAFSQILTITLSNSPSPSQTRQDPLSHTTLDDGNSVRVVIQLFSLPRSTHRPSSSYRRRPHLSHLHR